MSRKIACQWVFCVLFGLSILGSSALFAQGRVEKDFKQIFDGKTLKNWDGNTKFWKVQDGAITGQTTKENPTKGNTFIIWRGGKVSDFELKLEYRIVGGNSGIQYRSFELPNRKWVVGGLQADFEAGDTWSGALYGETFGVILAKRGQKTVVTENEKGKANVRVVDSVGDPDEIQSKIKKEGWNEYHIIARKRTLIHKINGVKTIEVTNFNNRINRTKGILALQLHAGPAMKVQFRNIRLKELNRSSLVERPEPFGFGTEGKSIKKSAKKKRKK